MAFSVQFELIQLSYTVRYKPNGGTFVDAAGQKVDVEYFDDAEFPLNARKPLWDNGPTSKLRVVAPPPKRRGKKAFRLGIKSG